VVFNGTGSVQFTSTSTISVNTTVNTPTFDWDGIGAGTAHTIHDGVNFTINSSTLDIDGDMDDPVNLGGNGAQLIVNGSTQWTMTRMLSANTAGVGTATIGGTSRLILSGAGADLNVHGNTTVDALLTLGPGSVATIDAGMTLRLAGGSRGDPNMLLGGTISGAGALSTDTNIALHGFGTINTAIDFEDVTDLFADNGTLTINGSILDVGRIGTDDTDGVLNVVNPWNTSVASFVQLAGGTIQGGTMTIDNVNAVNGFGTIASQVINNMRISASGGTLVVQTAGNDNDWDGTTNDASLNAQPNSTLELRDNATFGFTGVAGTFAGGRVFANGFALDFNPGSILGLGAGTYESTHSTDIGGVVNVNIGESTIKVANNSRLTFQPTSVTTLNENLRLQNDNIIIQPGASFTGTGALMIDVGSYLTAETNSSIQVLLRNDGNLSPAGIGTVGRIDLRDFQQHAAGSLDVEIEGTNLNQFDRLIVNGTALLGGTLDVDILGSYVPVLGDSFVVVSATGGVNGAFVAVTQPPEATMNNLYLHPILGATNVTLRVVPTGDFSADGQFTCLDVDALVARIAFGLYSPTFDLNGDALLDGADLTEWLARAGAANLPSGNPYRPGDANLDGVVDGSDFGIWNSTKFTSVAAWCQGDFSADGVIDGSDFGIWNSNKFTSSDSTGMVPEPALSAWCTFLAAGFIFRWRATSPTANRHE
jgi:hypothetical protein